MFSYVQLHTACSCLNYTSSTELVSDLQLPWMSTRFLYSECMETRSWEHIVQQGPGDFFKTGGLGGLPYDMLAEWSTWACWQDHPCLSRLPEAVNGDFMCYVYNDLENKWYPWAVKNDIDQHASCPAWTSTSTIQPPASAGPSLCIAVVFVLNDIIWANKDYAWLAKVKRWPPDCSLTVSSWVDSPHLNNTSNQKAHTSKRKWQRLGFIDVWVFK